MEKLKRRRLTFEFPEPIANELTELARIRGTSRAEILRRALALMAFLVEEKEKGGVPSVSYSDGSSTRILIA